MNEHEMAHLRALMNTTVSRRRVLRGAAAFGGLAAASSLLAACGGGGGGDSSTGETSGSGTTGSGTADPAAAAGLNAIFGPGGPEGGSDVKLSAGLLLAITGQGSYYGGVMSAGPKLAAAQIKAAGGFDYEISIGDHKSGEVPAGMSATRELLSKDKIKVLQTSYGAPSEAIMPMIAQHKLLTFNGGGSSPGQVGQPYLYQTRMLYGDDPCPGGLAWMAKNNPDAKRLAIIGTKENAIAGAETIGPEVWKQLTGGSVVANEVHDVGATDFTALVARVKAAEPDAIMTFTFGDDTGYQVKQLREAKVDAPIVGVEFTSQAADIAGAAYDTYNFAGDFYLVENPSPWNKIFVAGYNEMHGEDPEYYAANYYEHVFFFWELVRRAIAAGDDPTDTDALVAALESNPRFKSLYGGSATEVGEVEFNLTDHTISKPMGVFEVKGGKATMIQPITKLQAGADPTTTLS